MDSFFDIANDTLRWVAPVTGLVIMFLAWRRFESAGARLAATGFAVMLVSPLTRQVLRSVIDFSDSMNGGEIANRLYLISTAAGIVAFAGSIIVIFALRRLIAAAEEAEEVIGDGL